MILTIPEPLIHVYRGQTLNDGQVWFYRVRIGQITISANKHEPTEGLAYQRAAEEAEYYLRRLQGFAEDNAQ